MKIRIFFIFILGIFVMICTGLLTIRHLHEEKIIDESRTVYVKKTGERFQLIRNGKPFYIQGGSGNSHFKELAEIGGNTIRVYDTLNLASILDEAEKYGLAVIVDIVIPVYKNKYHSYLDEDKNILLKQKIRELVKRHRNHPALLMWNLGNELKYPLVPWNNNFINTFNDIVNIIHMEDKNHPVSTAIFVMKQALAIYLYSPNLDLLGVNIFGDLKNFRYKLNKVFFFTKIMPFYISEWGSDGKWERKWTSWGAQLEPSSTKKCEQIEERYTNYIKTNSQCLGNLVFFWGNKLEKTYTWFSLFSDNYKSEIIKKLEKLWNNSNSEPTLIGLDYMLVDGKGAADNIVIEPNEVKVGELKFLDLEGVSLKIKWEIYPESWNKDTTNIALNPQKPLENLFIRFDDVSATFITPSLEGPYRIFAYIYDANGYYATTNTPFYVLKPK